MIDTTNDSIHFPVGYHRFHRKQVYNFQLNRWHSLGYARMDDMRAAGKKIHTFEDWKPVWFELADQALGEDRLMNAAMYYRGAEFYTLADDPDKGRLYSLFSQTFERAFVADRLQRCQIPYRDAYLPALLVSPQGEKKGTILLHGGFDSFLEEWYLMMKYLARRGYEVIGFEGPGQGAALIQAGLPLDHRWEKPVGAVLDYFQLEEAILFGLSMGGWFCLRAAAFEPRIQRVAASGHAVDYMRLVPGFMTAMFVFFTRYENFFNKSSYRQMKTNPRMKWEINNAMHITRTETPLEAARRTSLALTEANMHPDLIDQDVLLLSSEKDHFIPIRMHEKQVKALVNARSVTSRIFTRADQAEHHCQIGNIRLMLDTFVDWLDELELRT